MSKNEITLAQANVLTQARYNFTVVEKRAVYYIIKEVRRQFIEQQDGQKDLFNDLVIKIKTADLQGPDIGTELREVYLSLKNLRRKSIWIEDQERVLEVGYINYFEHLKREPNLEVQVSHKILPFLVELAEKFTTYNLTDEYCSQFKSTGFLYISISDLREKMILEKKYSRYAQLKMYVLDVAHKELKSLYEAGNCDLYFNYSEDKSGRTVNGLKIVIISKERQPEPLKIDDLVYYIRMWLTTWLNAATKPKNKAWIDKVIKHLQKNPDQLPKLYDRLVRMQEKETSTSYAAFARYLIEEDYLQE